MKKLICILLVCLTLSGFSQEQKLSEIRSLVSKAHFDLYKKPISTMKLESFVRLYNSYNNKNDAYEIISYNMVYNADKSILPNRIYLSSKTKLNIPEVQYARSNRLYAMWFNLLAFETKTSGNLFIQSYLKMVEKSMVSMPSLSILNIDIPSMNNECEFAIEIHNAFNDWANNFPNEFTELNTMHDSIYSIWKLDNPTNNYSDFSKRMEEWTKDNTPFSFVIPSNILNCNDVYSNTDYFIDEESLEQTFRQSIKDIYMKLLGRNPSYEEQSTLMELKANNQINLKSLLYLIISSPEYRGELM